MEYRKLGKHGLKISAVSVGGHADWAKNIPDEQTEQIVVTAYDAGVNYIDSAEKYGNGRCDELLGKIIRKQGWSRDSLVIGSKISKGGCKGSVPTSQGMHRKHLVESCHRALRCYDTDHLDLFFCHRPDPEVPAEEVVRTMNDLIRQGKILYWGTSDHSPELLFEMHDIAGKLGLEGPHMEQTWYNLLGRARIERDLKPLFSKYGMGTTVYQPLGGGILTGKYLEGIPEGSRFSRNEWMRRSLTEKRLEKVRELGRIAGNLGISMPTFAVAWTLKNPNVSTAIVGASRPEQIKSNVEAVEASSKLTEPVMKEITGILGTELQY